MGNSTNKQIKQFTIDEALLDLSFEQRLPEHDYHSVEEKEWRNHLISFAYTIDTVVKSMFNMYVCTITTA